MSATPPRSGPPVALIIALGSAVLLALAGVIIALSISLAQGTPQAGRDDGDDEQPELSEIVLDAHWGDGSALDADELETIEDLVMARLERAGVDGVDFSVDDDQVHLVFDDNADEEAMELAAEALDLTFSVDFRPVLNSGPCIESNDYTDLGPDEEVVFCDQEGFAALLLGPSEINGDSIIGASTYQQDSGGWGVSLLFNTEGAAALASLTQRLVGAEGAADRLAITLGGEVLESPEVSEAIIDGEVSITGTFDEAQADALAAQLRFASKGLTLSVNSTSYAG